MILNRCHIQNLIQQGLTCHKINQLSIYLHLCITIYLLILMHFYLAVSGCIHVDFFACTDKYMCIFAKLCMHGVFPRKKRTRNLFTGLESILSQLEYKFSKLIYKASQLPTISAYVLSNIVVSRFLWTIVISHTSLAIELHSSAKMFCSHS